MFRWDDGKELEAVARDIALPNGFVAGPGDTVISLSFVNGTRTLTVAPASTQYSFWTNNGSDITKHTYSENKTIQISNDEGLHYIYFDHSGVLQETTTWDDDLLYSYTYVCYIYWDATNSQQIVLGFEQHGCNMSGYNHEYLHETRGAQIQSGGGALANLTTDDDGDDASDCQFAVTQVILWDEDMSHTINAKDLTDNVNLYYRSGADASDIWRLDSSASFPVRLTGNVGELRAAYNQNNAGTWQQTEVTNNQFVLAHVFAFNDRSRGIGVIQGQADYNTISAARDGATTEIASLNLRGTAIEETKFLGTLIIQTNEGYGNAVKSRLRTTDGGDDYIDLRSQTFPQGATSSILTDHGQLGGLTDTDHPASAIYTDTSNFDNLLSASETTVQAALEVLDEINPAALSNSIAGGSASATITADGLDIDDGSTSVSINISSGDLIIINHDDGSDVYIKGEVATDTVQTMAKFVVDGAVTLYYNDSGKFETTNTGAVVTGTMVVDNGDVSFTGEASIKSGGSAVLITSGGATIIQQAGTTKLSTTAAGISITDGTATAATIVFSSDDLYITNNDADGLVYLTAEKSGTGQSTLFRGDPDGDAQLFYAGTKVFATITTGQGGIGLFAEDGNNQLDIYDNGGWIFYSYEHGSPITFQGEKVDGTASTTLLKADPDGAAQLYYAGGLRLSTSNQGISINTGSSNGDFYFTGVNLGIYNYNHAGEVFLYSEKTGGSGAYLFKGDPDGAAELYYAGTKAFETVVGGFQFYDNVGSNYGVIEHDTSHVNIRNRTAGQNMYLKLRNTANSANVTYLSLIEAGAVELYYDGTKVFETGNTGGCLFYRQAAFPQTAITSSSNSVAWNLATAQAAVHTLTENTTIAAPSNMVAGATYTLKIIQAAGVYTLAWNAAFDFGDAGDPAEPAANGDVVICTFYSDGSTMYGVEMVRVEA